MRESPASLDYLAPDGVGIPRDHNFWRMVVAMMLAHLLLVVSVLVFYSPSGPLANVFLMPFSFTPGLRFAVSHGGSPGVCLSLLMNSALFALSFGLAVTVVRLLRRRSRRMPTVTEVQGPTFPYSRIVACFVTPMLPAAAAVCESLRSFDIAANGPAIAYANVSCSNSAGEAKVAAQGTTRDDRTSFDTAQVTFVRPSGRLLMVNLRTMTLAPCNDVVQPSDYKPVTKAAIHTHLVSIGYPANSPSTQELAGMIARSLSDIASGTVSSKHVTRWLPQRSTGHSAQFIQVATPIVVGLLLACTAALIVLRPWIRPRAQRCGHRQIA